MSASAISAGIHNKEDEWKPQVEPPQVERWPMWASPASDEVTVAPVGTWLSRALKKVAKLEELKEDWDSYGSEAPNELAAHFGRMTLINLEEADFEPAHVDPSADGGICISFTKGGRKAAIECFNTGEIFAAVSSRGKEPRVWELFIDEMPTAIGEIKALLVQ